MNKDFITINRLIIQKPYLLSLVIIYDRAIVNDDRTINRGRLIDNIC